jgi:hypothetical protein
MACGRMRVSWYLLTSGQLPWTSGEDLTIKFWPASYQAGNYPDLSFYIKKISRQLPAGRLDEIRRAPHLVAQATMHVSAGQLAVAGGLCLTVSQMSDSASEQSGNGPESRHALDANTGEVVPFIGSGRAAVPPVPGKRGTGRCLAREYAGPRPCIQEPGRRPPSSATLVHPRKRK